MTHAHFLSILNLVVQYFRKQPLWPLHLNIVFGTLVLATYIPPKGLMNPEQFKREKQGEIEKILNGGANKKKKEETKKSK